MPEDRFPDSDLPARAGRLDRLQLRAGRLLVTAVNLIRPRVTLGVRLVALDDGGAVFLVRHSYLPGWHLPGGGVHPGETCRGAVEREAREEGGLELAEPPELVGIYLNRALANRDHVAVYLARGARAGTRSGGLEICDARFHRAGALPEDMSPGTRARIAEVLEGAPRSEFW